MHPSMIAMAVGTLLACGSRTPADSQGSSSTRVEPQPASADPAVVPAPTPGSAPDAGTGPTEARFGDPLPGLTPDELALFDEGKVHFQQDEEIDEGVGPVFNEASCVACHLGPAVGGSTGRLETRFGRHDKDGGFDPLTAEGGSLLQDHGIGPVDGFSFAAESVPPDANVVASRRTTPLFGLGLVDATPDDAIRAVAAKQARSTPHIAGRVALVPDLVAGKQAVGKFGWKNGVSNLMQFSADAYLNEMGITSPLFPNENCPQGRCDTLAFNPVPGLNDADGADVVAFANFMIFLDAPPRGPQSEKTRAGERVFEGLGCAVCHTPTLSTGPNAVAALDRVEYHAFSDFLLHDMGILGDGIAQGAAGEREMRTAPLWGLRSMSTFLHDGRANTVTEAILGHEGQACDARDRFKALGRSDREAVLAFLDSL